MENIGRIEDIGSIGDIKGWKILGARKIKRLWRKSYGGLSIWSMEDRGRLDNIGNMEDTGRVVDIGSL